MPEWKTARRTQFLGHISEIEQTRLSKFMGQGPLEAEERRRMLSGATRVEFRKTTLEAFHKYVATLAGTGEDIPNQVWTKRKLLLEKAMSLDLGVPG